MMTMIKELIQLGLRENEAILYETLIKIGETTAGTLIKKTKLHRNTVYETLERLSQKGFITTINISNTKYFRPADSDQFAEQLKKEKQQTTKKEETLRRILPHLQRQPEMQQSTEATLYKGKTALKNVFEEIATTKELLVFGTGWGMKKTFSIYYKQWHKKLIKNKVHARILLPHNKKTYAKPFSAKYLNQEEFIPSTIVIWDKNILNIIWEEDPTAVLIKNEKIAITYKKYFEILWKNAKYE